MRRWSHDELHELIEGNPILKAKSDTVHALPPAQSSEEREAQKLQMMGIYAEAVACNQIESAKNALREVYVYLKKLPSSHKKLSTKDWRKITQITASYARNQQCHSPQGNDFVCFCNTSSKPA